jgi:hypothetical protein
VEEVLAQVLAVLISHGREEVLAVLVSQVVEVLAVLSQPWRCSLARWWRCSLCSVTPMQVLVSQVVEVLAVLSQPCSFCVCCCGDPLTVEEVP